ncbi:MULTISPECIES: lipocalin family protein [unclassified Prevotella]|uniref:lipocalin family protein n=1 Tax=unclassified Prevotella TaxID=2638335 RepID=UPI00048F579F|nr:MULTISPECIES: lipocalin family protein [unclassified Prevotella]
MKKLVFLSVAIAVVMLMSCGGGGRHQAEREEDTVDVNDLIRDHTIYGLCSGIPSASQLKLLTDNGDTLTLDITRARSEHQLLGSFRVGDRLAVMTNKAKTVATEVINVNLLLGDWVMPDPLDGSDEVGIRIKEGGVAESIEMTNITYRTWRIFNGKLEITSIRESGGEGEETNFYNILKLSSDTLIYKTIGKPQDEEETLEYTRWREKPLPDLHGLKLEEHQDEFMKM